MSQTGIDEILNSIKSDYEENNQVLNKAITDINAKLENFTNDNGSAEDVKAAIQDLLTELDNRHNFVSENFESIKDSLEIIKQNYQFIDANSNNRNDEIISEISKNRTELNMFNEKISKDVVECLDALKFSIENCIVEMKNLQHESDVENFNFLQQKSENFEKLLSDIQKLLDDVSSRNLINQNEYNAKFCEVINAIEEYKEQSVQNRMEIKGTLQGKLDELERVITQTSGVFSSQYGQLETKVNESIDNIQSIREAIISSKEDTNNGIVGVSDNLSSLLKESVSNIKSGVDVVSSKLDMTGVDLSTEMDNHFERVCDLIEASNADKKVTEDGIVALSNSINFMKSEVIANTDKIKEFLTEQNENISTYTSALKECVETLSQEDESKQELEKISEKILALETAMHEAGDNFADNLMMLQNRIYDFSSSMDSVNEKTDEQLTASLNEFTLIKTNISSIMDKLQESSNGYSEELGNVSVELLRRLDEILDNIKSIKDDENIEIITSLRNNTAFVEEKLLLLQEQLTNISSKNNDDDSEKTLVDKIGDLKQELSLISTDVSDIVNAKLEVLTKELYPLKEAIEALLMNDYNKFVEDIRSQIELSYLNFSADVISSITENHDNYIKLQDAYSVLSGKFTKLEELINGLNCLQTEGISVSLQQIEQNITNECSEINGIITCLKSDLKALVDKIDNLAGTSSEQLLAEVKRCSEDIKSDSVASKDEIISSINTLDFDMGAKLDSLKEDFAQKNIELNASLDALSSKVDVFAVSEASSGIKAQIDLLHDKLDTLSENSAENSLREVKDSLEVLSEKISGLNVFEGSGNVKELEELKDLITLLMDKVDIMVFPESDDKLDKIQEFVNSINEKIDILAMSEGDERFEELEDAINSINEKMDIISLSGDLSDGGEISNIVKTLSDKVDFLALSNSDEKLDEISKAVNLLNQKIEGASSLEGGDNLATLQDTLNLLSEKIDILAQSSSDEKLDELGDVIKSIYERINLISYSGGGANFEALESDIKSILTKLERFHVSESPVNLDVIEDGIRNLHDKIDSISFANGLDTNFAQKVQSLQEKLDYIATHGGEENIETRVQSIQEKVDYLASNFHGENIENLIQTLHEKVDCIAMSDSQEKIENMILNLEEKIDSLPLLSGEEKIETLVQSLHEKVDNMVSAEGEEKIENMVQALHAKVDVLAASEDAELYTEIQSIKTLIEAQRKQIEQVGNSARSENISKSLSELEHRLAGLDFEKNASDIKDSVMNAILAVADQITFVEETEEIKDFVEERTDEINKSLREVKQQLSSISSSSDSWDYSYTMQDIESDIAKLRIILSDISASSSKEDIVEISKNMHKLAASVNALHSSLTEEQILELKHDVGKINEDVVSISSRTNKLLLTSDESYRALTDGLEEFGRVTGELQSRIEDISNNVLTASLESKLDGIKSAMEASAGANDIIRQVMIYLGEWIDDASQKINSISEYTSDIPQMTSDLSLIKTKLEDNSLPDVILEKFEEQQQKINSLENKLELLLNQDTDTSKEKLEGLSDKFADFEEKISLVDEKLESLTEKMVNLDDRLQKLSQGIEKLASYVD